MAKQDETRFKERVKEDLKRISKHCWHTKVQQRAIRGTPDILACVCGVFIAIELKRSAAEEPDRLQRLNIERIKLAGGIGLVAFPENWAEVYKEILSIVDSKKGEEDDQD